MDTEDLGGALQARMAVIRGKQQRRIAEVQTESERMIDWREHVKSAPLTALSISAIVGFLLMQSRQSTKVQPVVFSNHTSPETAVRSERRGHPLLGMALSLASNFALTAGKRFVIQQLQSFIKENQRDSSNESKPNFPSKRIRT
jgi:hypothetical protein